VIKKADWSMEFDNFITKNRFKGFKWGSWDCCKFSNACIKAMTGEDLIPKELKWKNEAEAMKSIKEYGKTLAKSIEKACKSQGVQKIDKAFMQKGDLVVYKEESELVGISDGFKVLSPTDDMVIAKQNVDIISVWRIPNG
jgi:hypothetical protein